MVALGYHAGFWVPWCDKDPMAALGYHGGPGPKSVIGAL